jgi:DNA-binding response OmpR family regulator
LVEKHHEDLFRQALDAGAYDVLVKPVEEGSLLFAVQRAIEVSRLRHQVTRAHAQFVASVGRTMRDLEVLYSAYGLEGHFEALMASLEVEKTAFAAEPQPRAGESGHGAAASDARVMKRQF